jgi:hypothetical protein
VPNIDNNFEFNEDNNEYELTLEVSVKKFILEFFLSDNSIEIRIQKGIYIYSYMYDVYVHICVCVSVLVDSCVEICVK